ncbi:DUF7739 domain-containing protein [Streptomyces hydrogenans]
MNIVTSHGGDFFGEDRHPVKLLTSLAGYAEGVLPTDERRLVVALLEAAGQAPVGVVRSIEPTQAAEFAPLFRRIARHRFVKSRAAQAAAELLAAAAARAGADGEPWTWTAETTTTAAPALEG